MAIARVQIAPTGYSHVTAAVASTFGALPTVGNALVAMVYDCDNGVPANLSVADWAAGGWGFVDSNTPASNVTYAGIGWRLVQQSDRDAGGVISLAASAVHPSWNDAYFMVAEYSGFGGPPALDVGTGGVETPTSQTALIPTITPAAGKNRLLVANVSLNPNYGPAAPGTWTKVQEEAVLGNRQTMDYLEKLVASTAGSYGGDTEGPVGLPAETSWRIPIVALGGAASSVMIGGSPGGGIR